MSDQVFTPKCSDHYAIGCFELGRCQGKCDEVFVPRCDGETAIGCFEMGRCQGRCNAKDTDSTPADQREQGYYWITLMHEWPDQQVGFWDGDHWAICGDNLHYHDDIDVIEVGESVN